MKRREFISMGGEADILARSRELCPNPQPRCGHRIYREMTTSPDLDFGFQRRRNASEARAEALCDGHLSGDLKVRIASWPAE
jgi:hypothetical protein